MQKKLIALAIAGLATAPAFAQSNVTVYGVADVTLESVKAEDCQATFPATCNDKPSRARVSPNSSLLGFRGTEALGNGLNAIFQFETGMQTDGTGVGTPFNTTRDSFVGLQSGGFGTLTLGNHTGPNRTVGLNLDLNPGATGIGFNGSLLGELNGVKPGFDDRLTNSVRYLSPSWGGFSFAAIYGANEGKSNEVLNDPAPAPQVSDHTWGGSLTYATGPLYVAYGYERRNDKGVTGIGFVAGGDGKDTDHKVGIKYTFAGAFTLGAIYDRTESEGTAALIGGSGKIKRDAWGIIGGWTGGPHQVILEFTIARDVKCSGGPVTGLIALGCSAGGVNAANDTGAKMYEVAYNYSLSKRTMLKTYYARITNEQNASYDFYINGLGNAASGTAGGFGAGADPQGFGVGFRHIF